MVWTVEGTVFCLCVLKNTEDQEGAQQLAQLLVVLWEEEGNWLQTLDPLPLSNPLDRTFVRGGGRGRGATAWKQDFLLRDFSLFFWGKTNAVSSFCRVQRGSRRTVQSGRGGSLRRRARRGAMRMCLRIALLECSRVRKRARPSPLLRTVCGGHFFGGGRCKSEEKEIAHLYISLHSSEN